MSGEPVVAPSGLRATRTAPAVARGGVVLVPDGQGSTPGSESAAAQLVDAGFVVVVPDLAWRTPRQPPPEGDPGYGLSDPEAIADLVAARELLPPGARFVVGVGLGGLYARVAACAVMGLAGAVGFGGRVSYSGVNAKHPIQPLDLLPGLSCPLQCHFDIHDAAAPPAHVDELERRLAGTTQPWQVFRYGNAADPDVAPLLGAARWTGRAPDARTAWARTRSFLLHLAADRA
ncbi:MAG: dienelactone hydrolase family protein [Pseudomonadota bacterium]|nr:dienelactone hydrolase family protein [Pseudomonadota bacterium]